MRDTAPLPLTRDLVLIGGGHTHALILRRWAMDPLPGARLTLIDPGPTTAYSGMLPGFVAGHYAREELEIDLVRLARFAGARIILGRAEGIDRASREIHVAGRPPVGYDIASLDIGITSDLPDLPGFAEHAVPAKPLGPFADAWAAARDMPGPVAVIGAGIAGVELAMAMTHALRERHGAAEVHLVEATTALSDQSQGVRRKLLGQLREMDITLHENVRIVKVTRRGVTLQDGTEIRARFVVGAAGARPQTWLSQTGLELHEGFVSVNARLQSSDPAIFAAGDCAHLTHAPRPKAGVYAVRAADTLLKNLKTALGSGSYKQYFPQKDYLKLVSLGDRSALATRSGFSLSGPLLWRWKDRIDRNFMEKLQELPQPKPVALPWPRSAGMTEAQGPKPLCGGCGAKLGHSALSDALARLPEPQRRDVTSSKFDDSAILTTGDARQVMTTDHLRAMVEDPVVMTRIACHHALGDIWAMGARPQVATLSLILPRLSDALAARTMSEIMQTASEILRGCGAEIVGGHSSIGAELTIGLTLTGLCDRAPITLSGAKPGDALILTKPLGSGTILAAEMQYAAPGAAVAQALEAMCHSQETASRLLGDAHAMTDVTGFGLVGHLQNIAMASGTGARIDLANVPFLPGAVDLAAQGHRSSLYPQNRAIVTDAPDTPEAALLFDPQTSGGLLAAVAPDTAAALRDALRNAGYPAALIGTVTDRIGQIEIV
ncbi:selenide, water dikinase SelD [Litorisediminicola beolgyonensis]|uniref:Selenide, water dikinase SelD n=1 Tax=Litorisediminicola beolgyonensis TaxID=1173614 RepID=A0ABW3ZE77_9RHOB